MKAPQVQPSLFAIHATTLHNNGWRPLPGYQDTKRPSINGWDVYCRRPWQEDELFDMIQGRGQTEGKMVCLAVQSDIIAIDIDVEVEQDVHFIWTMAQQILGVTPLRRIGRYPRMIIIYRSDGTVRSRKHHPLEIFCGSGQFVGFGYHLGAQKDYQWPVHSPLTLKSDDPSIPIISQNLLDRFLEACWTRIPKREAPNRDYVEALFVGDVLVQDREQAFALIEEKCNQLANAFEGGRNELLFHVSYVSGQAIASGLVRREEVEQSIINAATACGLFHEDGGIREVRNTMRSGFDKGGKAPFFTISKWFEKVEDVDPIPFEEPVAHLSLGVQFDENKPFTYPPSLIKGLLPRNGVAFIGGQSGAGKTFLVCDLAVALTTQQSFFGRKVKEKVGVVILAGEGAETLQPRITVARTARNIDAPLPIAWISNVPNLADAQSASIVLPELKKIGQHFQKVYGVRLGAVVLDTLAATFLMQDENDNSEAAKILKVLATMSQTLDCLVLPVHHYGKGAETGLRGASAWRAGSDAVLSVTAERNHLTGIVSEHKLWLAKSRVGEEGPVGDFDLKTLLIGVDEDGDELTSCYVVPQVAKQFTVAERKQSEELLMEIVDAGEWREDVRSEQWIGLAVAEAYGLDVTEKGQVVRIKALLKRLLEDKKLVVEIRQDEKRRPRKYILSSAPVAAPVEKSDILSEEFSVFD